MSNRAQRRSMAKSIKGNTQAISSALRSEGLKAVSSTTESFSIAVAMVLWDSCNHDKAQLNFIIKRINKLFDEIIEGRISLEDCKKTLRDEAGYKL